MPLPAQLLNLACPKQNSRLPPNDFFLKFLLLPFNQWLKPDSKSHPWPWLLSPSCPVYQQILLALLPVDPKSYTSLCNTIVTQIDHELLVLVSWPAITKYQKLGVCRNRNLFFHNYGGRKFKIKFSIRFLSSESPQLVDKLCFHIIFPVCLHPNLFVIS